MFPAVMKCRHVHGSTVRTASAPVHFCRLARCVLCCPDVQVYAWRQVLDGPRHRAIFSDPEWPSTKNSRYFCLADGFFALHNTLMFLCEGTVGFKEMKVRLGSLQVTCSCTNPVSCFPLKGEDSPCPRLSKPHRAVPCTAQLWVSSLSLSDTVNQLPSVQSLQKAHCHGMERKASRKALASGLETKDQVRLCKGSFNPPPKSVLQEDCRRWKWKDKKEDRNLVGMM